MIRRRRREDEIALAQLRRIERIEIHEFERRGRRAERLAAEAHAVNLRQPVDRRAVLLRDHEIVEARHAGPAQVDLVDPVAEAAQRIVITRYAVLMRDHERIRTRRIVAVDRARERRDQPAVRIARIAHAARAAAQHHRAARNRQRRIARRAVDVVRGRDEAVLEQEAPGIQRRDLLPPDDDPLPVAQRDLHVRPLLGQREIAELPAREADQIDGLAARGSEVLDRIETARAPVHDEEIAARAAHQRIRTAPAVEQRIRRARHEPVVAVARHDVLDRAGIADRQRRAADARNARRQIDRRIARHRRRIQRIAPAARAVRRVVEDRPRRIRGHLRAILVGVVVGIVGARAVAVEPQRPLVELDRQAVRRVGHFERPVAARALAPVVRRHEGIAEASRTGAAGIGRTRARHIRRRLARTVEQDALGAVRRDQLHGQVAEPADLRVEIDLRVLDRQARLHRERRARGRTGRNRRAERPARTGVDAFVRARALLRPRFGEPHGRTRTDLAEAVIVARMHAAAVPVARAVVAPLRRAVAHALRGQRENLLHVAIAEVRIRLQHQRNDARHDRRREARALHVAVLAAEGRAAIGLQDMARRHDIAARRGHEQARTRIRERRGAELQRRQVALRVDRADLDGEAVVAGQRALRAAALLARVAARRDDHRAEAAPARVRRILRVREQRALGVDAAVLQVAQREIVGEAPAVVRDVVADHVAEPAQVRAVVREIVAADRRVIGDADAALAVVRRDHHARDHGRVIRHRLRQRAVALLGREPCRIDVRREIRMMQVENLRPGREFAARFELADAHALAGVVAPHRNHVRVAQIPLLRRERIGRHVRRRQRDGRAHRRGLAAVQVDHGRSRVARRIGHAVLEAHHARVRRIGREQHVARRRQRNRAAHRIADRAELQRSLAVQPLVVREQLRGRDQVDARMVERLPRLVDAQRIVDRHRVRQRQVDGRDVREVELLHVLQRQRAVAAGLMVGHGVAAVGAGDCVVAVAAVQRHDVGAAAAVDRRVAVARLDHVVARAAEDAVRAAARVDHTARCGRIDRVARRPGVDHRLAAAADDRVVARAADQHVVAAAADQRRVALPALEEHAAVAAAHQHVVAAAAFGDRQARVREIQRHALVADHDRGVASAVAVDLVGIVARADHEHVVARAALIGVVAAAADQPAARRRRDQRRVAIAGVDVVDAELRRVERLVRGGRAGERGAGRAAHRRRDLRAAVDRREGVAHRIGEEVHRHHLARRAVHREGAAPEHLVAVLRLARVARDRLHLDLRDAELFERLQFAGRGLAVVIRVDPHAQRRPDRIVAIEHAVVIRIDAVERAEAVLEAGLARHAVRARRAAEILGQHLARVRDLPAARVDHQHPGAGIGPAGALERAAVIDVEQHTVLDARRLRAVAGQVEQDRIDVGVDGGHCRQAVEHRGVQAARVGPAGRARIGVELPEIRARLCVRIELEFARPDAARREAAHLRGGEVGAVQRVVGKRDLAGRAVLHEAVAHVLRGLALAERTGLRLRIRVDVDVDQVGRRGQLDDLADADRLRAGRQPEPAVHAHQCGHRNARQRGDGVEVVGRRVDVELVRGQRDALRQQRAIADDVAERADRVFAERAVLATRDFGVCAVAVDRQFAHAERGRLLEQRIARRGVDLQPLLRAVLARDRVGVVEARLYVGDGARAQIRQVFARRRRHRHETVGVARGQREAAVRADAQAGGGVKHRAHRMVDPERGQRERQQAGDRDRLGRHGQVGARQIGDGLRHRLRQVGAPHGRLIEERRDVVGHAHVRHGVARGLIRGDDLADVAVAEIAGVDQRLRERQAVVDLRVEAVLQREHLRHAAAEAVAGGGEAVVLEEQIGLH